MRRSLLTLLVLLAAAPSYAQLTPSNVAGETVNDPGSPRWTTTVITINFAGIFCNAVTCDVSIATIPPKTRVYDVVADLTQAFVCAATCTTATLSVTVGKTAGGAEYLASFDADAAAARFGLLDAERGTVMTRAAAIGGGDLPSWTAGTTLQLRMTSGTGNVGNGTVTNFNAGSITFHILAQKYP